MCKHYVITGVLGSYQTNKRDISIQLMAKIQRSIDMDGQTVSKDDPLGPAFADLEGYNAGGIQSDELCPADVQECLEVSRSDSITDKDWRRKSYHLLCTPFKELYFEGEESSCINGMLDCIYPDEEVYLVNKCTSLHKVCVHSSTYRNGTTVFAKWYSKTANNVPVIDPTAAYRPGSIIRLLQLDVVVCGQKEEVIVAEVAWMQPHPEINFFRHPVEVWGIDPETYGLTSYIPVGRIACVCAASVHTIDFDGLKESVTIIIPVNSTHSNVN